MDLESDFNRELARYVFVLVLIPVWVPFLKALWGELKRAIRPDGGLLGPPPSARQRAVIEREIAKEPDPLIHEPIANRRFGSRRAQAKSNQPSAARGSKSSPARSAGAAHVRRRGFR